MIDGNLLGIQTDPETIKKSGVFDGLEIDLVTHEYDRIHNPCRMAKGRGIQ